MDRINKNKIIDEELEKEIGKFVSENMAENVKNS